MKRLDVRETARDEEAEALEHAKAIPSEANYNAELHQMCDVVMKRLDVRETARDEEVEAGEHPSFPITMPNRTRGAMSL